MARKDLVRVTVSVDGVNLGVFRSMTGGDPTSGDGKSVRGAGEIERARGGRQQVSNVVVAREDDGTVDLVALAGKRGKAGMVVHRQPLDDDFNARGRGQTYTGIMMRCSPGPADAESTTDLDEFELEMSCDSLIS